MNRFILLPFLIAVSAFAQEAKIDSKLNTTGDVWVGQRVTLIVELLSPTHFTGTPAFDLPRVPGMQFFPPQGHPVQSTRSVGDTSYAVQQFEVWLFPQRAGSFEIPAFLVRFDIAGIGVAPAKPVRLQTTPISFRAQLPPGADGLSTLISTSDLTVEDTWTPNNTHAKVGDALTHRIVLHAEGIPGMAFPPLPDTSVPGFAIYRKSPQVNDQINRGEVTGERIETITYLCKSPGTFKLPGYALTWWDLDEKILKTAEVGGLTVEIAPAPIQAQQTQTAPPAAVTRPRILVGISLLAAAFGLLWWSYKPLRRWVRACHKRHIQSEPMLFKRLIRSCRTEDARTIYRQLLLWWQSFSRSRALTIGAIASQQGERNLARQLTELERAAFGVATSNTGGRSVGVQLAPTLRAFRRRTKHAADHNANVTNELMQLNPTASCA